MIKQTITRLFNRLRTLGGKPIWKDKADAPIIHAFACGGADYFKFKDINNLMSGRAFAALDYFEELSMRCTREYLQAALKVIEEQIEGTEINIGIIAKQVMQIRERTEMIIDPDIILKIASVVYFDTTEQPWAYDFQYNYEKIARWKKEGIDGFFLKIAFQDLLPGLALSDKDFQTYTKTAQAMTKEHMKDIFTTLSTKNESAEWYKRLKLLDTTA